MHLHTSNCCNVVLPLLLGSLTKCQVVSKNCSILHLSLGTWVKPNLVSFHTPFMQTPGCFIHTAIFNMGHLFHMTQGLGCGWCRVENEMSLLHQTCVGPKISFAKEVYQLLEKDL